MKKTIYIAGKTTGLQAQHVINKFERKAAELTEQGHRVVQPARLAGNEATWEDAMRTDIKTMMECDEVHLLPCWQESRSARLKRDIAVRLGMQVVYW